jgi:hypothetical protein
VHSTYSLRIQIRCSARWKSLLSNSFAEGWRRSHDQVAGRWPWPNVPAHSGLRLRGSRVSTRRTHSSDNLASRWDRADVPAQNGLRLSRSRVRKRAAHFPDNLASRWDRADVPPQNGLRITKKGLCCQTEFGLICCSHKRALWGPSHEKIQYHFAVRILSWHCF